ncbi:MAG: NAD(P)H-dependent oxidoreductase [Verrucomicrobiota bacterium]
MAETPLKILAVIGSLHRDSVTRIVLWQIADKLKAAGGVVDVLDFEREPLPLYNPDTAYDAPAFPSLIKRVDDADVLLLGTPDYHGSMSGAMKSFLDHFWREFAGKLFATVVASHEKGLTVTDQLRTVARQCYAWTLPYGVSFSENFDLKDGKIASENLEKRIEMLVRDVMVYGKIIAQQRLADLGGTDAGFLARHRK